MATIKAVLRTSRTNELGEAPIAIRITKDRQSKFIFLDYKVKPAFWASNGFVKKEHPNAGFLNIYITQKIAEVQAKCVELETTDKTIAGNEIKEHIKGKASPEFFPFAERYAYSFFAANKIGTYTRAKSIIGKLNKYVNGRKLTFASITVSFLKDYEYYLQSKLNNRINTVNANLRLIRTIFFNAVREDLIQADSNPFLKMKLKLEKTQRAYLTEDELTRIEMLPINENYVMNHHRNIYVFAAYAGGLRISDILNLRWNNFDGDKINIRIQKTQSQLSVKLPTKALEIINFYKKEDAVGNDFIFPLLKISKTESNSTIIHRAITSATTYTNKNLNKIAEMADIDKHLSFHTSRHTWATRALQKGMRIEHVSKLLGHTAIRETQIYARIINADLDNAMEVFN